MQKTQEQLQFIEALASADSLELCAVAGSGKTTTLLMGLEVSPIPARETLLLAFNVKIKEELAARAPTGTVVLTLNGLGHRAWMKHTGGKLVVDSKKVGGIVSSLCKEVGAEDYWADIKDLVAKAKAVGLLPTKFTTGKGLVQDTPEEWERLADLHSIQFSKGIMTLARKALEISTTQALAGRIDFDDQLYMPACFRSNLDKYKLVLVDEAQDLSEIQHFLISRAVANGGRLISVGDPNQAIYGFRGALSDSMPALSRKFNSRRLSLTQSFRCSKAAVKLAQRYVPRIEAFEANLEGSVTHLGLAWKPTDLEEGSVVLCRNIAPLVKLGMQCIKAGVPAYVAGRDIGAPLLKAVKQLPIAESLVKAIILWSDDTIAKAKGNLEIISRTQDTTDALLAVVDQSTANNVTTLANTLKELFARSSGSIVLSTVHRAKGLEWNTVYFLDSWRVPQKWILKAVKESPDAAWMLEQEKNLYYIAVTRTKDKLIFIDYEDKHDK